MKKALCILCLMMTVLSQTGFAQLPQELSPHKAYAGTAWAAGTAAETGVSPAADAKTGAAAVNPYGTGDYLYHSLILTGSALPEDTVFSVHDLELLYEYENLELRAGDSDTVDGTPYHFNGLDLPAFLRLCGLPADAPGDTAVAFFSKNEAEPRFTAALAELTELTEEKPGALLAFSPGGVPLADTAQSEGGLAAADKRYELPALFFRDAGETVQVPRLSKIKLSAPGLPEETYRGFHRYGPYTGMRDITFTVNFLHKGSTQPFRTVYFSTEELETLMRENPEQVRGNYFGVIGNADSKASYGLGGFLDYFEGPDLWWLLTEKAGLTHTEGYAEFFDRENELFATVPLSYFRPDGGDYSRHYVEISDALTLYHTVPALAVSKNRYPLLPEHEHESEGYRAYGRVNREITDRLGLETEIGVIKNHNGPFVACLPNLDGVYGGTRAPTGNNCLRMDIYVEKVGKQ